MEYSIGKAAEMCDLPASTLRYYEKEGLVEPARTPAGVRRYSEEDIAWLQFIDHMRSTGMSIADLARYVKLRRAKVAGAERELLEIMLRHEQHLIDKLAHYQTNLELVQYKIRMYQSELAEQDVDLFELYKDRQCANPRKGKTS
ncbi:MerR family transcriptional regulator [Trueperella sp. LYQ143]|uniref:MerR family transcriptional regulator n=1 Tax=unclassified Trueperella TaxID=2630174 RepID=UPI0039835ACA